MTPWQQLQVVKPSAYCLLHSSMQVRVTFNCNLYKYKFHGLKPWTFSQCCSQNAENAISNFVVFKSLSLWEGDLRRMLPTTLHILSGVGSRGGNPYQWQRASRHLVDVLPRSVEIVQALKISEHLQSDERLGSDSYLSHLSYTHLLPTKKHPVQT